jgi:NAD(P)-dependent dehydrogenase (short-subunit alcohol dehydrogenase family)
MAVGFSDGMPSAWPFAFSDISCKEVVTLSGSIYLLRSILFLFSWEKLICRMELTGKVALITGSTSGIGKAIAELFARQGASLIVHGREVEKGNSFIGRLREAKAQAYFQHGDIGLPETSEKLVQHALKNFGRLDVVVANAGMLGLGNVTEMDPETWRKTIDVNLNAVFYLCRAAIPAMMRNGGGTIIVNSSVAAFKSFPNHAAYCASKAGVAALARQVALDYGPDIRVNVICPGPVDTPLIWDSAIAFPDPEKAVEEAGQKTVMNRLGLPEDIASLVLFLASDKSSWMTGSVITIDGGVTIN